MNIIQDSEYVLFKAFANHIKTGLEKPLNKINLRCFDEFSKFEKLNDLFLNSETYENLGDSSKKLKTQKKSLIEILAIQDRIEKILKRNEQRLEFINARLAAVGIYNDAVDKKTFNSELSKESKNIECKTLNLNPRDYGGIIFKFFAGERLAFKNDVLDFSLEENRDVLIEGSSEFFHEVIFTFPYSVATIPDESFMMASVKNKILKECVLFVASKLKVQSIYESNKELGFLLENTSKISDISHFARELRNYFNVIVKQCIKSQAPELAADADLHLKCSEGSEFLPVERRVYGAETVVSDINEENEENQESKNKSQETVGSESSAVASELVEDDDSQEPAQVGRSTEELLDLLLSDDDDDVDEELEEDSTDESNENIDQDSIDSEFDKTLRELESMLDESDESDNEESEDDVDLELDETLKELESLSDEEDDDEDERRDNNG